VSEFQKELELEDPVCCLVSLTSDVNRVLHVLTSI